MSYFLTKKGARFTQTPLQNHYIWCLTVNVDDHAALYLTLKDVAP